MVDSNRRWIVLVARFYIGIIFFLAGLTKLFDIGVIDFLETAGKQLQSVIILGAIPSSLVMVVPFLELLLGIFLIVGLERFKVLVITAFFVALHSMVAFLSGAVLNAVFNGILLLVTIKTLDCLGEPFFALDGVLPDKYL